MTCSSRSLLATIAASGKPSLVQDLPGLDTQVGQIAGVEADAGQLVPRSRSQSPISTAFRTPSSVS